MLLDSALDASGTTAPRSLRLQSGGQISLGSSVQIIFETCSLAHVAPGSLGKAGVLVLEPSVIAAESRVHSWLDGLERDSLRRILGSLFQERLPRLLQLSTLEELRSVVPTSTISCICGMLRILDGAIEAVGSSRYRIPLRSRWQAGLPEMRCGLC